ALRPNAGRVPWWALAAGRRVPGTRVGDYLPLGRLLRAPAGATIADVIPTAGPLWDGLLATFFRSALNTPPEVASARLAGAIVRETILAGGAATRPRYAVPTLAAAFVEPALAYLRSRESTVRLATRVRAVEQADGRVAALRLGEETVAVEAGDAVIVATPPWIAADLLPGLTVPDAFHAIVNAHFAVAPPPGVPAILAVNGGTAEWLVAHGDRVSVTVSAADALAARDRAEIAAALWADIRAAYRWDAPMPPFQIVKEMRATFAATPAQDTRRPAAWTGVANLFLAGDWTQTRLPATIEGAIRSGATAAGLASRATSL
ncbi:MAG: FAD-dependent oxidoreductase, partial [Sphingomonadaceae bacterium]|nr:FAD-dependent oxidoreductase [Sphingomonadaceae bacterium]